jgi:DNA primase
MGIVDEDVARVRESTDIVAVISQYTQLKRVGRRWSGLCPFHAEKSPSFSVNQEEGLYHCFGCKASGDAITFMREIEHLDFVGAVEALAAKAGIALRYTDRDGGEDRRRRERLARIMDQAVDWYHERLRTGADAAAARAYLRGRGFDAGEVARYRLGWAPDSWDALCRALRLSEADLDATGLGMRNRRGRLQDFFRARVLFPIYDEQGRAIGFGGRKLPDAEGAKYQNSRDSATYHKSKALYGLNWAKADVVNAGEVVVCEGYTDVIGFNRAGIDRAVATCGTALTEEHVKLLSRFCRRIVLAYDADEAGQSAAERVYAWEKAHDVGFWVVDLPPGSDPDELARDDPDALAAAVAGARPFLEFRVRRALDAGGLDSAEGRARAAEAALEVIAEHPDPLVVDQYLMEVAERARIDVDRLRERLVEVRARPRPATDEGQPRRVGAARGDRGAPGPDDPWGPPPDDPDGRPAALPPLPEGAEREALRMALRFPDLAEATLDMCLFAHPTARAVLAALQHSEGVGDAVAAAPPGAAEELTRLSVEDLGVEPLDALARLATEVARAELVELEMEARSAPDPLVYSDAVGYLKVSLDELRRSRLEEETVLDLLDWLRQRRRADGAPDATR